MLAAANTAQLSVLPSAHQREVAESREPRVSDDPPASQTANVPTRTLERACQEPGSGPKPTVKVAEQRDLSPMVYLLVQQDGHNLTRGPAAAEVTRPGF